MRFCGTVKARWDELAKSDGCDVYPPNAPHKLSCETPTIVY